MVRDVMRSLAICFRAGATCAALALSILLVTAEARAQNPEAKPSEPPKGTTEPAKERVDEITDASRNMTGPAARAECVWLGERAVGLMWRDDLDTAFRHLDLYDRFGCPGEHVQISFRCVVRQGNIDQKATETFNARVHSCWINPANPPTSTAAAASEKPAAK
jgi:hypothetical protein